MAANEFDLLESNSGKAIFIIHEIKQTLFE